MSDSISQSFTVVVDESILVNLQARKDAVLRFIKKNFREGIDYIEQEHHIGQKQHGGHNRKDIKMTDNTYNLLLSTYNLKHKYVQAIDNLQIRTILMSVESSTIGFICNCLKTSGLTLTRQYVVGNYRVDLYISELRLVVECDEFGHQAYNKHIEDVRTQYIKSNLQCDFVRFNPNATGFDISEVLAKIIHYWCEYQKTLSKSTS